MLARARQRRPLAEGCERPAQRDELLPDPDGQRWARSGEKGSTFRLDIYVEDDIVFPVHLVALWGIPAPVSTGAPVPVGACVGLQFTTVGPKIGLPSANR